MKCDWMEGLEVLNVVVARLEAACAQEHYSLLELAGLIQTYEYAFVLCREVLGARLAAGGHVAEAEGDVLRRAAELGWLSDLDLWLGALESHPLFAQTYRDDDAQQAAIVIRCKLAPLLRPCVETLNRHAEQA